MRSLGCLLLLLLACVVNEAASNFPSSTNQLLKSLETCSDRTEDDVECVSDVKDQFKQAVDYIQKVTEVKNKMKDISDGLKTFNRLASFAKYIPVVGQAVTVLKTTLNAATPAFTAAYKTVLKVETKLAPVKNKCSSGVATCDKAIKSLEMVNQKCNQGKDAVRLTRDCLVSMQSSKVKTTLTTGMSQISSFVNPLMSKLNAAFGNLPAVCAKVRKVVDIMKTWPSLEGLLVGLNSFYDKLKPVLDFFEEVQKVLEKKICANLLFKTLCFSAQQILDGISSLVSSLTNQVAKLLDGLKQKIPSFNLPGMPSFQVLDKINIDFDLDELDFQIDSASVSNDVSKLDWTCSFQIEEVCSSADPARKLVELASQCSIKI